MVYVAKQGEKLSVIYAKHYKRDDYSSSFYQEFLRANHKHLNTLYFHGGEQIELIEPKVEAKKVETLWD